MAMSQEDIVLTALRKLDEETFLRFKARLSKWNVKKKFEQIPTLLLEDAGPKTVADLIWEFYGINYGFTVTQAVLDAINAKRVRGELLKDGEGGRKSLVEEHRLDLMNRKTRVDLILYYLHHLSLLTDKQYHDLLEIHCQMLV
ncbi:pyrin-like [Hyperolius riggenbachi]|uniref:pyrin-like n=1 Tax=Hyperolius riggenbachi TaxID=752182 RepID=UPI0035A2E8C8